MLTNCIQIDNTLCMKGTIRTKEKCPKCKTEFQGNPLRCPTCLTTPKRFFVDLYGKGYGRIKIYSDKQGHPLDSYQRALRVLEAIRYEIDQHIFDPSKYVTADIKRFWVSSLIDNFLEKKLKTIAPSYQRDYERMTRTAKDFFNNKDVRDLRKIDLVDFKDHIGSNFSLSPKSIKNILDVFKTFLRWCLSELEVIDKVPAFPQIEVQQNNFRWLSTDEQLKILEHVPDGHKPIIIFLMLHGCRPGEARALRCKNVDIKNQSITISATFSNGIYREKRKGRRSNPVTVPIHPEMYDFLKERVTNNLPEAYVLTNPKTGRYYSETYLKEVWQDVRKKAGLNDDVRLYDATRHSFASILANGGVSLYKISKLLGHSSIKTTEKYAHSNIEYLRADIERLSLKCVPKLSPNQNFTIKKS